MDAVSPNRRRLIAATAAGLLGARLPSAGRAQDATPSPVGPDDGSLEAMLARAHDPVPVGGAGPSTLFTYGNIARQLEVRGLRSPDPGFADKDRLSEWADGVDGLALDDVLIRNALLTELWSQLGFSPAQVTQTMTVGDPPRVTRIYRGAFDAAAVRRALVSAGYEEVRTERGPVLTNDEAGDVDLDHPIQRVVVSAYNNVALVDDAYVVASPFLDEVEATLAAFAGDGASLASNRSVATLVSAVGEELVSATVLDGHALSVGSLPDFVRGGTATPVVEEPIPPAAYALFGLTPGSMPSRYVDEDPQLQGDNDDTAPRSAFVVALHLGSTEEAAAAVPVIERRVAEGISLMNRQPYAELLGEAEVKAVPHSPVVKVRLTGDRVGRIWLQAVFALDLAFVFTE